MKCLRKSLETSRKDKISRFRSSLGRKEIVRIVFSRRGENLLKSICAFVGCRGVVHPLLNGHSSSNLVVCFFVPCSDVFEFDFLLFAVHLDRV